MTNENKKDTKELNPVQEQTPPAEITAEEWQLFKAFRQSAEKRFSELMSVDEIRQMVAEVIEDALRDRPSSTQVAKMIQEMHAAETQRVDFVLTSAIESVKMYGDEWARQNESYVTRLTQEHGRATQLMQDAFAREVTSVRESVQRIGDRAESAVNQHAGQVQFLQQLVQRFDDRTSSIAERQDDQGEHITQLAVQINDSEKRFSEWMQPFQGESGFIALVKKQSKVIEAQQRGAEMRQSLWRTTVSVIKRPEFWALFGAGGASAGAFIMKLLGAF